MYKLVKFKLVGYNTLTPRYPLIYSYAELDFNHPDLANYINKFGEPLNFVSDDNKVAGYIDVVAQKSADGYYTLIIDTDNPDSCIIGYLKRFIFKDGVDTERVGIAVKLPNLDYAVSIFSIYSPCDWELHDNKYDPPVVLRFPMNYVSYGYDVVQVIPVIAPELQNMAELYNVLLINKLETKYYVKKDINPVYGIEYPLYIYKTTPAVTPAVKAYDDDRNYYDVYAEKNAVRITFPEKRRIPDVVYLEITDAVGEQLQYSEL